MRKLITFLFVSCLPLLCGAQGVVIRPNKPSKPVAPVSRPTKSNKPSRPAKPTIPNLSVSSPDAYISGHGYVDLGLSVKWATCNIGAFSPYDYGYYFAWGEISAKPSYTRKNSKTDGVIVGEIAGNPSHDAARKNWTNSWRLPTKAEYEELRDRCIWTWIKQNGHYGYHVQGGNGKSIFIPAAGRCYGTTLDNVEEYGYYWSSTPDDNWHEAYLLNFSSSGKYMFLGERYCGHSIRPVSE